MTDQPDWTPGRTLADDVLGTSAQPTPTAPIEPGRRTLADDVLGTTNQQPQAPGGVTGYWQKPEHIGRWNDAVQAGEEPEWLDTDGLKAVYNYISKLNGGTSWTEWQTMPSPDDMVWSYLDAMPTPPESELLPTEQLKKPERGSLPITSLATGDAYLYGLTDAEWASLTPEEQWATKISKSSGGTGAVAGTLAPLSLKPGSILSGVITGFMLENAFNRLAQPDEPELPTINPNDSALVKLLKSPLPGTPQSAADIQRNRQALIGAVDKFFNFTEGVFKEPITFLALSQAATEGSKELRETGKTSKLTWKELLSSKEYLDAAWKAAEYIYYIPTDEPTELQKLLNKGDDTNLKIAPVGWEVGTTRHWKIPKEHIGTEGLSTLVREFMDGKITEETALQEMQERYGYWGETRDLLATMILDLTNFAGGLGLVSKGLGKVAKVAGFSAAMVNALQNATGQIDAVRKYKATSKALQSFDEFKNLKPIEKALSEWTDEGIPKSLVKNEPKSKLGRAAKYMFSETPESRATGIATDLGGNAVALMEQAGDLDQAHKWNRGLATNTAETAAEIGTRAIKGPEAYALPMALRRAMPKLDALMASRAKTKTVRTILKQVADLTGRNLDDIVKMMSELDPAGVDTLIRQAVDKAVASKDLNLQSLVDAYNSGALSGTMLKETTTGLVKSKTPLTESGYVMEYFKTTMEEIEKWAADYIGVKPDPWYLRMGTIVKHAQGLVLLDYSPKYLLQNGLDNLMKVTMEGVFGLDSAKARKAYKDYIGAGYFGHRGEGFKQYMSQTGEVTSPIQKAARPEKGMITSLDDFLRAGRRRFGLMSKMSNAAEGISTDIAMVNGFRRAINYIWQPGKGFDKVPADLRADLEGIRPGLADWVDTMVASHLSKQEIEDAIWKAAERNTIDDTLAMAASETGMPIAEARDTLQKLGIADFLKERIKPDADDAAVIKAFEDLEDHISDQLDKWVNTRIKAEVERIANKVQAERGLGVLDAYDAQAVNEMLTRFTDWDQYEDVFEYLGKVSDLEFGMMLEAAYRDIDKRWKRQWKRTRAIYLGITEALGLDSRYARDINAYLLEMEKNWEDFYTEKRAIWREAAKSKGTKEFKAKVKEARAKIRELYIKAADTERAIALKQDGILVELVREFYGDDLAVMAQSWRDGLRGIRDEMVDGMLKHRAKIDDMKPDAKRAAWSKYVRETQKPQLVRRMGANLTGAHELFMEATKRDGLTIKPEETGLGVPPEQYIKMVEAEMIDNFYPPEGAGPLTATQTQRMNEVRKIASRYGVASADKNGDPLPGFSFHVDKIVRRYGPKGLEYRHIADLDPKVIEQAFKVRKETRAVLDDLSQKFIGTGHKIGKSQAAALTALIEGNADYLGMTPKQWAESRLKDILKGGDIEDGALLKIAQEDPTMEGLRQTMLKNKALSPYEPHLQEVYNRILSGEKMASIAFDLDGRAVIRALTESTNVVDMAHELGHLFRRTLKEEDLRVAEDWAGITDGIWHVEHEEKFARAFEKYLAEGVAPTARLEKVFRDFKQWIIQLYKSIVDDDPEVQLTPEMRQVFDKMLGKDAQKIDPVKAQEMGLEVEELILRSNQERWRKQTGATPENVGRLFSERSVDPIGDAPMGTIDGQYDLDWGKILEDDWTEQTGPLIRAMKERMIGPGAMNRSKLQKGDLNAEQAKRLRRHLEQQYTRITDAKLAASKIATVDRDKALLNYSKRYGFNNIIDLVAPYHFWYLNSTIEWALRAIDRPAWLVQYGRIREFQNRHNDEDTKIPRRLWGKIQIPMNLLPEGMGNSIWVDPLRQLFSFEPMIQQVTRPLQRDFNNQTKRAEWILEQMGATDQVNGEEAVRAIDTHTGALWERAWLQAGDEIEKEIANPIDLWSTMYGPSLPISIAYNKMMKRERKLNPLPSFQAVTDITSFATPGGYNTGGWLQRMLGAPERGYLWNYYMERQLMGMAATDPRRLGEIKLDMVNQSGPAWTEAMDVVGKQQAIRNWLSMFVADFFPEGEQESYQMKEELMQVLEQNDPELTAKWFDENPAYEAQVLKTNWDDPEERAKRYLITGIWNKRGEMTDLDRRLADEQLGEDYQTLFLDKETRSYDSISLETLVDWAHKLGVTIPGTAPQPAKGEPLQLAGKQASTKYDEYIQEKNQLYPEVGNLLTIYYDLPQAMKDPYLKQHPEIREYWEWRDLVIGLNPELIPYMVSETKEVARLPIEDQERYYQYMADKAINFPGIETTIDEYYELEGVARKAFSKAHPEIGEFYDFQDAYLMENPDLIPYIRSDSSIAKGLFGKEFKPEVKVYADDFDQYTSEALMAYTLTGVPLGEGMRGELHAMWEKLGKPRGMFDKWLENDVYPLFKFQFAK